MELKTKYITKEDFKLYFGIDLEVEMRDDDNPSNKVDAFIKRWEDRVASYCNANFYRNIDTEFPKFTDYQKEHYKLALLEQCYYAFTQGDLSVDSGYSVDEGIKADRTYLHKIKIADNTKEELILCGIWCRHIKNRGRGGLDGWWMY